MKRIISKLFCLIFLLRFVSMSSSADLKVTTAVNRNVIPLNQQFTLTVELSGEAANKLQGDPGFPPGMEDFAIPLGGSNSSQNIQIINGRMSVTRSIQYRFAASKIGKFVIEPVSIVYKGKSYKSKPINIEIVKAAAQSQKQQRQRPGTNISPEDSIEDNLFLRMFVNKTSVYQNEPVLVKYKIYTKVNINSYGISRLPNTAGFWEEDFESPQSPKTHEQVWNGRKFLVAEIKKMALFPTGTGQKTIDPMIIDCDVRMPRRRRTRDIFDFFDDPFFGRTVRKRISSLPLNITVLPLPEEGKPADFSGAVGYFKLSANVDKKAVETNEAINLKIKISGRGNIKMLPAPNLSISTDIEQYTPTIHENISRSGNSISGSKTYEYVLIPRRPGVKKIKPIRFSYFDPNLKSYKTLTTPEILINVKKGKKQFISTGPGFTREEVKLLGQDIRYIERAVPDFRRIGHYYYKSLSFILLLIIPLFIMGGALGYRRYADKLSENIAYARSRKATQIANKQLKHAKKLLKEKTQKQFYSEIAKALSGFLANKLNLEAAGMMADKVQAVLAEKRVDKQVVAEYFACLQTCDFQRFASASSGTEQMQEFYHKTKDVIIKLQKALT